MGYLGRRIGLSQDKGDSTPGGADGAVGGGILDLFAQGYFERQDKIYNSPGSVLSGMTASGGIINDYIIGNDVYRAHIFTSSGTFDVSALGDFGDTIEYLVIAGGASGGQNLGGGWWCWWFKNKLPWFTDLGTIIFSICWRIYCHCWCWWCNYGFTKQKWKPRIRF